VGVPCRNDWAVCQLLEQKHFLYDLCMMKKSVASGSEKSASSLTDNAIRTAVSAVKSEPNANPAASPPVPPLEGTVPQENGRSLIEILTGSKLYREYERAFSEAVGSL